MMQECAAWPLQREDTFWARQDYLWMQKVRAYLTKVQRPNGLVELAEVPRAEAGIVT